MKITKSKCFMSLVVSIVICLLFLPSQPGLVMGADTIVLANGLGGDDHRCAVKNGEIVCWGSNTNGQASPPAGTFLQVSDGYDHSCGLKSDKTVACWGSSPSQNPPLDMFEAITAGGSHNCGLKSDGSVRCWGNDANGELSVPDVLFQQISAGDFFTCGIAIDNTIQCWGSNVNGRATPPAGQYMMVASGKGHACALTMSGSVICWGKIFDEDPVLPAGTFDSISSGSFSNCGLRADGTVRCWGGPLFNPSLYSPTGKFTQVGSGNIGSCGIMVDGTMMCWDGNYMGMGPRLKISPAATPAGQRGVPYDQWLDGTGGSGNYLVALVAGALPDGLSLVNNRISGTPTKSGTFSFRLRLTGDWIVPLSPYEADYQISINSAPVLNAIANQTVKRNESLSFAVTAFDSDDPQQTLTFSLGPGAPSTANINASSGFFTWNESKDVHAIYSGVFPITVIVKDSGSPALSDSKTFEITVEEIETNLLAFDDSYTTEWQTQLTVTANNGVLVNDRNPPHPMSEFHADVIYTTQKGSLLFHSDGSFEYIPANGVFGHDTFTYKMTNGTQISNDATVWIMIKPPSVYIPYVSR